MTHRLGLGLLVLLAGCASQEETEAEQALTRWGNQGPRQYTYVLQPVGGSNQGSTVRIRVEREEVLEVVDANGHEPDDLRFSMTRLLERARELAAEDTFHATYDEQLGYLRSLGYAPGPEEEPGWYGFNVLCFEPNLRDGACADEFAAAAPWVP